LVFITQKSLQQLQLPEDSCSVQLKHTQAKKVINCAITWQ